MSEPADPFLGTGWSFPPTFLKASSSVAMVSGVPDIRESIWILLSTAKGERVMEPDYGCDIWQYVFRTIDNSLIGQIDYAVSQALLNWEPRITVERVETSPMPGTEGALLISIDYTIRKTNARSNIVFPFYLEEGSIGMPESQDGNG